MDLLEIRTQFVKISGRYDLVVDATDFLDNGANWYITQGQKSLERRINIGPSKAHVSTTIAADAYTVTVPNCRAITGVTIIEDGVETPLYKAHPDRDKLSLDETTYTSDDADTDKPTHWYTDTVVSQVPSTTISTSFTVYPPADVEYSIRVEGLFYNYELTLDTDENTWSTKLSSLLVMSALRQLERMYRGSKSASAWDALIEAELITLDMDAVEEESANVTKTIG